MLGIAYDHAVDMWSLGCILYELVTGEPLFPAKDENELMEYFIITLGEFPDYMLRQAKKYKQFFGSEKLIRSPQTSLGHGQLIPRSSPVSKLLAGRTSPDCIDFITKCLAFEPEDRMTPQAALHHKWIVEI